MRDEDKQYLADHYYEFLTVAMAILRDEEEARDAVQEAMALTMARQWVKNLHRYCNQVLRHYCWDRLKERYVVMEPMDNQWNETLNERYEQRLGLLNEKKAQLPRETVLLLDLHYGRGMTVGEMAEMTGRSEKWIKKKIEKTLRWLREGILYEESKQNES